MRNDGGSGLVSGPSSFSARVSRDDRGAYGVRTVSTKTNWSA